MRTNALAKVALLVATVAVAFAFTPAAASAQAPAAAPAATATKPAKPYKPVAVKIIAAPRDAAFAALRKDLGDIAKRKDRAALSNLVVAKDFFWERDFGGGFDPQKSSLDNLSTALSLEDEASAWDVLAGFAAEPSAGPLPGRPEAICTPATPQFDDAARDKLLDDTESDGIEWLYPRAAGLPVRAAPKADAAVVETLGLAFVRVLGFDENSGDGDPVRTAWARVAAPSGKTGFIAPGTLVSPYTDRLCFGKGSDGAWRIVGYVGGGD
jgi:hypothetical protein